VGSFSAEPGFSAFDFRAPSRRICFVAFRRILFILQERGDRYIFPGGVAFLAHGSPHPSFLGPFPCSLSLLPASFFLFFVRLFGVKWSKPFADDLFLGRAVFLSVFFFLAAGDSPPLQQE